MNIGIAAPCNPSEFIDYYYSRDDVPSFNLTASSIHSIIRGLLKCGHNVVVFTSSIDINHNLVYEGEHIKVFVLTRKIICKKIGVIDRFYMVSRLKKIIKANIHSLDVLHAHWTYDYALACAEYSKLLPVFCTIRDWCPYLLKVYNKTIGEKIYWRVSYWVFRTVIYNQNINFIANSEYTYNCFLQFVSGKKIPIIYNSIREEFLKGENKEYPKTPVFIAISTFLDDPRKNMLTLLKAFKKYNAEVPESKLLLVGQYKQDSDFIKQCKIDDLLVNVKLEGLVPHEKLIYLIDSTSILIHPSLEETFGNILLEGMARKVPIIAGMNAGAVPFILKQGKYGCLCDVKKEVEIYNSICMIMNDEVYRNLLVENAFNYLKNNYLDEIIVEKHISLYESILNERR